MALAQSCLLPALQNLHLEGVCFKAQWWTFHRDSNTLLLIHKSKHQDFRH